MKKIIICTLIFVIAAKAFCQQTKPSKPYTSADYLQKSKNQKSAGWVLLGGGTALVAGGLLIGNRKESSFDDAATGAVFGALGVISALGSIPLFLASGRNKRKAASLAYLKFENPLMVQAGTRFISYPAACLKINL